MVGIITHPKPILLAGGSLLEATILANYDELLVDRRLAAMSYEQDADVSEIQEVEHQRGTV